MILTQPRDYRKKDNKLIWLMKIMLKKYPNIVQAMKNRAKVYNHEKDYVFSQEKLGKTFVICPEEDLQISRTEKNPDELQRVYDLGRKVMQEKLEEFVEFAKK